MGVQAGGALAGTSTTSASQVGNSLGQIGTANAAGAMGEANAIGGAFGGLGNAALLSSLASRGGLVNAVSG